MIRESAAEADGGTRCGRGSPEKKVPAMEARQGAACRGWLPRWPYVLVAWVAVAAVPIGAQDRSFREDDASTADVPSRFDFGRRELARIPAGTVIGSSSGPTDRSWRLVMLAKGGDSPDPGGIAPRLAARYAATFGLALIADLQVTADAAADPEDADGEATARHSLRSLRVGICLPRGDRHVVVTPTAPAEEIGGLDFVARQVLARSDQDLGRFTRIAKHRTACLFDSPAVVRREGKHRQMVLRHLVWVNPRSGKLGSLLWLMAESESGRYRLVEDSMQALPIGFAFARQLSIDADEFILGVPSPRALALEDIPRHTAVPVSARLAELAALPRFDRHRFRELTAAINTALRPLTARGDSE